MESQAKIFVAGHRGLVGGALLRRLRALGYDDLLLRTRQQADLADQASVRALFRDEAPDYVIVAAAKVGGILANRDHPAEFIYENLMIASNVVHAARQSGVKRLLFLGSSCIYPKHATQPMCEDYLLSGALEPTNEAYAVAKIAGIKLCESYNRQYGTEYLCAMPTNLYGPGDNFDLESSHVLPALIRKFHEAKVNDRAQVVVWGTGTPRREFLHVDDLADACVYLMNLADDEYHALLHNFDAPLVNIGCGVDLTIRELAETVKAAVGFEGEIVFDDSKPDGTPRKLLDSGRLQGLGWTPKIDLRTGIEDTYQWFLDSVCAA